MEKLLIGGVETVRLRRIYEASAEVMFRAWTDPDEFTAWWQPSPYKTEAVAMDVRSGGAYRITMRGPNGESQCIFGNYLAVEKPTRLSMTWSLQGSESDDDYVAILLLEFNEGLEGTELSLVHDRLPVRSMRMYRAGWLVVLSLLANRVG